MDPIELKCNFKKCRKPIREYAWVTSCSHIFCNEDGRREFQKDRVCPACSTKLPAKLDVISLELNPSEQYKSMALAGLSPDIIMDVATRALSFWTYQCHNELTYQAIVEKKGKDRCSKLEQLYTQTVNKFKNELKTSHEEIEVCRNDTEKHRQRCSELSEKLLEKTRQLQKVQLMYENMRRKCVSPEYLGQTRSCSSGEKETSSINQDFAFNFSRREESSTCGGHAVGTFLNTIHENVPDQFQLSFTSKPSDATRTTVMDEELPVHLQNLHHGFDFHPDGFNFMGSRGFNI